MGVVLLLLLFHFCLFYSWFSSLAHCLYKSIAAFVRNLYLAKQSNQITEL